MEDNLRSVLLREAARLFAAKGFDATSVQDVVEAGEVTKGAFYYHFESKDELLHEIHQRFITYELEQAEVILSRGLSPRETLHSLVVSLVESIALFQPEVTIFFREMHRLSPGKFEEVRTRRDRYERMFRSVIEKGQEIGAFRRDISPTLQTLALFGMCNWTYMWYRQQGEWTPQDVGGILASIFLAGVDAWPALDIAQSREPIGASEL